MSSTCRTVSDHRSHGWPISAPPGTSSSPILRRGWDPKNIEAIVLIDEIDLHLHPTLQRALVPRLRKALPKVQWVVTTHSPLVLANFDVNEIVALDRNEVDHIRPLDRQIMGFSTDQIYEWLMGTRPTGVAIEEVMQEADQGRADRNRAAILMRTSPEVSEEKALEQVSEFDEILRSFRSVDRAAVPGGPNTLFQLWPTAVSLEERRSSIAETTMIHMRSRSPRSSNPIGSTPKCAGCSMQCRAGSAPIA